MSKYAYALCGLIVFGGILLFAASYSGVKEPLVPVYATKLSATELSNAEFGKEFPLQYDSYLKNSKSDEATMTRFKGSIPFHKNDNVNPLPKGYKQAAQPYLKNLWAGYPFMWEYNESRGHTYAIHDILAIDRINRYDIKAGLPATCWNCKTPKIPSWVEQYGDDKFWSKDFNELRAAEHIDVDNHTIGCANCHDPKTMELVITSIPLKAALEEQGIDLKKATRNEMRAYVCGQCHVEYYFQEADHGSAKKPVFPWKMGKNPEEMYEYYQTKGPKKADGTFAPFTDWVHPVSKIPMLKAQHPEFELWQDGVHGSAGVSCADCHMAFTRTDGKKKMSSHVWTSPLRSDETITQACGQCHTDKTPEYLRKRVEQTQEKTYNQLLTAQDYSVRAHEAIRRASEWTGEKSERYTELMAEAREYTRKAQFFWDLISAENSVGFHNPVKALDTLALSQQYSQKGFEAAVAATNYGIAKDMEADIKELVPPIVEWSREMQMEQENLDKHVWTKYLKLLPKSEKVWDQQKLLIKSPSPEATNTTTAPVSTN